MSTSTMYCVSCEAHVQPLEEINDSRLLCSQCGFVLSEAELHVGVQYDERNQDGTPVLGSARGQFDNPFQQSLRKVLSGRIFDDAHAVLRTGDRHDQMVRRVRELATSLYLKSEKVPRVIQLIADIIGPYPNARLGASADLMFGSLLLLVARESKIGLSISDCAKLMGVPLYDFGQVFNAIKSCCVQHGKLLIPDEPPSFVEKTYNKALQAIEGIFEKVCPSQARADFDDPNAALKHGTRSVVEELLNFAEFRGFHSGRNPYALAAAAVSVAFQVKIKAVVDDKFRNDLRAASDRKNIATMMNIGYTTVAERESELLSALAHFAASVPWVAIPPTKANVLNIYNALAPVVRVSCLDHLRKEREATAEMRRRVKSELGEQVEPPQTQKEIAPAPQGPALPMVVSKSRRAVEIPDTPSVPVTPAVTSSPAPDASEVKEEDEDFPKADEPKMLLMETMRNRYFPPDSVPAFQHRERSRERRIYQVQAAIDRLRLSSHGDVEFPFEQWERVLNEELVQIAPYQVSVKKYQDANDSDTETSITEPRNKRKRSTSKPAKPKPRKVLGEEAHLIEKLLREGVSVRTIVHHGKNLSSLLHTTPLKLEMARRMLEQEESSDQPNGELVSDASVFAPSDIDFQINPPEQQRIIGEIIDRNIKPPPAKRQKLTVHNSFYPPEEPVDEEEQKRIRKLQEEAQAERAEQRLIKAIRRNKGRVPEKQALSHLNGTEIVVDPLNPGDAFAEPTSE